MFQIEYLATIHQIPANLWSSSQPFLCQAFWVALEETGAIGQGSSWLGQHVLLRNTAGQAVAALPLFVKQHNRGEYVFDHAWADAYRRYGLDYLPRLVTSVPFTPVTGQRVLLAAGIELARVWPLLAQAIAALAERLHASSWHALFVDQALNELVAAQPLGDFPIAQRLNCQFLWTDQGYGDFDGFLAALTAKRRKSIKVERAKVASQGICCRWIQGADLTDADWDWFYQCYAMTYRVRGQQPYLQPSFFKQISRSMPESIALAQAVDVEGKPIAAALFFQDEQTLYGRYWGALVDADCLHFELCYYQGIDYALQRGLRYFDPGTQGEHKLIRGFAPVYTQSLHWLREPAFMAAISDFVQRERVAVGSYYQSTMGALPFKKSDC
ncbi:MAG: GNAT family N-acetyltransferase [Pseudomonadota bacterium]|nr:GNAT family N-acetyltransferase [Pseudomonadota bacterium]